MRDSFGELLAFIKDMGLGEEVALDVLGEEEKAATFGDVETERCIGDEDTGRGLGDEVRHRGLDKASWLGCRGREKALLLPATPVAWMTLVCLLCSSLVSELRESNGAAWDCVWSIEYIPGLLEKQRLDWSIGEVS